MSDVHVNEVVLLIPADASHADLERDAFDLSQRLVNLCLRDDRTDVDGHAERMHRGWRSADLTVALLAPVAGHYSQRDADLVAHFLEADKQSRVNENDVISILGGELAQR